MIAIKDKLKEKMKITSQVSSKVLTFVKQVNEGEFTDRGLYSRFINTIKVFIVSTRKFMVDDCLTRASAIAYTIVTSLIPLLTVFLTFFSIFSGVENKKEDLFRQLSLFMVEHSIKLNIDPVIEAVSGLIDNAGKIGGIGAIVVLFTATATLRSLEKSLNDIWNVKQGRSLFQKILYYWAALTLGPVLLIAGTTVATKMTDVFSSANFNSAFIENNRIWIVGSKGSIKHSPVDKTDFTSGEEGNFDYENQDIYSYKSSENAFYEDDFRLDSLSLMKENFTDIQFIDDEGWIISSQGIILHTKDRGKSWTISKWGDFTLNDIHMIDRRRGFIAADGGILLATESGGQDWRVIDIKDVTMNLKTIDFFENRGIATGTKGRIYITEDAGLTWTLKTINESKRKNKLVDLNAAHFVSKTDVWIGGNDGIILHSSDGGTTWQQNRFKEYNYYSVFFINQNEGFIGGENGIYIHTVNGGTNWKSDTLPAFKINKFIYSNSTLWAIGNGGTIQKTSNNGKSWSGKSGKSFFAVIINFLAPFLFIWLLFLAAYKTTPNTRVPLKYASIGAAFTGTVWVIFILLFIVYIKAFATGTFAIYGALASIPIFLLMIYASSVIILYGAEVSYTLMHPETYANLKTSVEESSKINIFFGLVALHHIYTKFESGKGNSTHDELLAKVEQNSNDLNHFMKMFQERGFIQKNQDDQYTPSMSSEKIRLVDVFSLINEAQVTIPPSFRKSASKGNIITLFDKINSGREKVLENMTLKDLKMS